MKVGDPHRLKCGHEGRIVWIDPEKTSYCVKGTRRRCLTCGKGSTNAWTPTVYFFSVEEQSQ